VKLHDGAADARRERRVIVSQFRQGVFGHSSYLLIYVAAPRFLAPSAL
jgi:hypothetical protein